MVNKNSPEAGTSDVLQYLERGMRAAVLQAGASPGSWGLRFFPQPDRGSRPLSGPARRPTAAWRSEHAEIGRYVDVLETIIDGSRIGRRQQAPIGMLSRNINALRDLLSRHVERRRILGVMRHPDRRPGRSLVVTMGIKRSVPSIGSS
jgi:hypothetical protein